MVSVADLNNLVADYLSGSIDRKAFARRLFPLMYGIEKTGNNSVVELGYSLEFVLAEAIAGLLNENEFRVALAERVQTTTSVCVSSEFTAVPTIPLDDSFALPYKPVEVHALGQ